ncbi:cytidine deaminase [Lacticaseibacillus brantae]|uniref:Cytidine deaminase n=1 Tax=Lacticaseibacillus brantae DSM 23927 TaxID=1423727 RepID=A0A0R2B8A5_9LACO|nr:cytidine deaminase [Lacticaseibacillus brantae]KRM72699.1 cytidine deaminase [Lacticaseibacillus brantae DSM 23927]
MTDQATLIQAAVSAQSKAYVPYSHFPVGAVVTVGDEQFIGANIENASFGLSMCAERNAIFAAVLAGHQQIDTITVVGDTTGPISPCGACRQVMTEFMAPSASVTLANRQGAVEVTTVAAILPGAFTKGDLNA